MFRPVHGVALLVVCVVGLSIGNVSAEESAGESSAMELFNQRILPIFRSPDPSSCVQCHLASVDLKDYILPSHEQTFVSLRDQGLVDLETPEKSKILQLIRMGEQDLDEGARLIHEKVRQAELQAFTAWIKACCKDDRLRKLPPLTDAQRAGPDLPDEVIRHARKSRVVESFARNVFSQRMRCFPCHTPYEIDEANPKHAAAVKTMRKLAEEHPELVERMQIFRQTPEETLAYLIERSQQTTDGQLPLLNLEDPEQSLLLQKPMSKLPPKDENGVFAAPSSVAPVSHMGGLKMHLNDAAYKAVVAWLQDYASVVGGKYKAIEDLPADNWIATQLVLKLTDVPAEWAEGTPVQLFVHARSDDDSAWEPQPVAFTQGTVNPNRVVNGFLFLLRPTGLAGDADQNAAADAAATLQSGRYQVRVFADERRRLADEPALILGSDDFVGHAELSKPRWREGFRFAESVSGADLVEGVHQNAEEPATGAASSN